MLQSARTDHLVEATHVVEADFVTIVALADLALAVLAASDPVRADLVEIRKAALLAIARTAKLAERAASVPLLRAS